MENTDNNDFNATIGNTMLSAVHLAPYLPYELMFSDGTILHSIDIDNELMLLDTKTHGISNHRIEWGNILPVLRPISDLDLKIKIEFDKYDNKRNYDKEIINLFCEENGIDELLENLELSSIRYECVEYMFKNHYDFFGLIEKGLAVDINTLSVE